MDDDLETRIAQFERTNRRRRALAFAILGVCLLLAGAITIAFALLYLNDYRDEIMRERAQSDSIRLVAYGAIGILAGIGVSVTAYRIARGKILDG